MSKKFSSFLFGVALALYAGLASGATFNLFSPSNGILKGNANSYITSSATSLDVRSLWTGTCNASSFLRGDGACAAAGGGGTSFGDSWDWTTSVTDLNFLVPGLGGPFWLNVSTDGVADSSFNLTTNGAGNGSISAGNVLGLTSLGDIEATAVDVFHAVGGTGDLLLETGGVSLFGDILNISSDQESNYNAGTSILIAPTTSLFANAGTFIRLDMTQDLRINNAAGTAGQVLTSNGAGVPPTWQSGGGGVSFANPTASIGLTAVNGVATTAMRSDAAPALSQTIAPTWTAQHIFSSTSQSGAVSLNSAAPVFGIFESDQTANNRLWVTRAIGSELFYDFCNDAGTTCENYLTVTRTDNTAADVNLYAVGGTFNGGADDSYNTNGGSTQWGISSGAADLVVSVTTPDTTTGSEEWDADGITSIYLSQNSFTDGTVTAGASDQRETNVTASVHTMGGTFTNATDSAASNFQLTNNDTLARARMLADFNNGDDLGEINTQAEDGTTQVVLDAASGADFANIGLQAIDGAGSTITVSADDITVTGDTNHVGALTVGNVDVCLQDGTNCPGASSLKFASGRFTVAGNCNVAASSGINVTSCTFNSTGFVSLVFSLTATNGWTCTANSASNTTARAMRVSGASTTGVNVLMYDLTGTLTDTDFTLTCMGN